MRKTQPRSIEPDIQLERLQKKHAELAEKVDALDQRRALSSNEELELHALKRRKLQMKDEIAEVRSTASA